MTTPPDSFSSTRLSVVNRDINPLLRQLPAKIVRHTPEQVRAVLEIQAAFDDSDMVVLDAPTGSGKTVIAETVRLLRQWRGLYICHSKGLQDQFANDFRYGRVVKGRANYPTQLKRRSFPNISCDDCTWNVASPDCAWCDSKRECPYEVAKVRAIKAELAVVNSAYALTEWNGPGRISGRPLVIVDECDTLERVVQEWISVYVSERRMKRFGWEPPSKVTVADCWSEWLDDHIPDIVRREQNEGDEKERKRLERLVGQMRKVRDGLARGLPYAFTGRGGSVEFKPVLVGDYGQEAIWRHGTKWLLMSATVVSSSSMLRGLGYSGSWATVSMNSSFPSTNRPVVVRGVANMSRRSRDDERMARAVYDEVEREPGRVLVHTVSYDLAAAISRDLRHRTRRDVFTYRMASERAESLAKFERSCGSILVAPSTDRGVDLPDELCRLIIITKVPYPNLGDRMVSMRLYGTGREGRVWYTVETVRTIVQMAGRGVRHKEDWCRTVILDSQFRDGLWKEGAILFPGWFREAIQWTR